MPKAMSPSPPPRVWSPRRARWLLGFFPPLLFSRIRILEISPDFQLARIQVRRSFLTRNLNGTTFGGTLFSAADPIHAILYWQILARRGLAVQTWLKSARIDYLRPARTHVVLEARVRDGDIEAALVALEAEGKFVHTHTLEVRDDGGVLCAQVEVDVYVRLLGQGHRSLSGF